MTFVHAALFVERCNVIVAFAVPVVPVLSAPFIVKFCLMVTVVGEALAVREKEDCDSNA